MKKLIDELIIARDNADSIKEAQAVQLCINIVRAHNPWHEVGELPAVCGQEPGRSIEILILTADGNIYTGVYVFEEKLFIILNRRSIAKEIGWTYLPGGKS